MTTSGDVPADGASDDGEPLSREATPRFSRLARWTVVGLVLLTAGLCAEHAHAVFTERSAYQVDVDESAYLAQAVVVTGRVTSHDLGSVTDFYLVEEHQEAPLLSVLTVPFLIVGTIDLQWALVTQLVVLVTLVVATFLLARRLAGDPWSLLAAAVVGCAPGFLDYTRSYQFGLLSAATMAAAVWLLLASERFTRPLPSIAWGVFVGLTVLSRTVMVSLLPGLLLAGAMAALVTGPRHRWRVAWFGAGLASAALVALPWWITNWHAVSNYLKGFGFGNFGNGYGYLYAPTEAMYYLRIPYRMAQELYLPLTVLLLVGLVITTTLAVRRLRRTGVRAFVVAAIGSGHLLVVVVLGSGIAALMSSRNRGTGFSLPLLPLAAVLAVYGISRLWRPPLRAVLVVALGLTLLGDVAMKSPSVGVFEAHWSLPFSATEGGVPITDGRNRFEAYLAPTGYPSDGDVSAQAEDLLVWTQEHTATSGAPAMLVEYGDYLFNANLVRLMAVTEQVPSQTSDLSPGLIGSASGIEGALQEPIGLAPVEFLVTIDLAPGYGSFPGAIETDQVEAAARALGFEVVREYTLTEDRSARLWQREVATP